MGLREGLQLPGATSVLSLCYFSSLSAGQPGAVTLVLVSCCCITSYLRTLQRETTSRYYLSLSCQELGIPEQRLGLAPSPSWGGRQAVGWGCLF